MYKYRVIENGLGNFIIEYLCDGSWRFVQGFLTLEGATEWLDEVKKNVEEKRLREITKRVVLEVTI